jgi:SAM-dependent methyltransferase
MTAKGFGRVSTAGAGPDSFLDWCLSGQLVQGPILNVGCGQPAWRSGFDIVNVDHAAAAFGSGPRPVDHLWVVADATQLPFQDSSFSLIIAKDIVEHLADPIQALCELRRIASPFSRLVLTCPRAIPRAVWADPTHIRGFTASAIGTALRLAGWEATTRLRRLGSVPAAGHFPNPTRVALTVCAIPVLGRLCGTNWLVEARPRGPVL